MANDDQTTWLSIGAIVGYEAVELRTNDQGLAAELEDLLRDHGLNPVRKMEFSVEAIGAVLLVASYAVAKLGPVIETILSRHENTKIEFSESGHVRSIQGMKPGQIPKLLTDLDQASRDAAVEWERISGSPPRPLHTDDVDRTQ